VHRQHTRGSAERPSELLVEGRKIVRHVRSSRRVPAGRDA